MARLGFVVQHATPLINPKKKNRPSNTTKIVITGSVCSDGNNPLFVEHIIRNLRYNAERGIRCSWLCSQGKLTPHRIVCTLNYNDYSLGRCGNSKDTIPVYIARAREGAILPGRRRQWVIIAIVVFVCSHKP